MKRLARWTGCALLALGAASCGRSEADWIRGLESYDLLEQGLSAIAVAEVAPRRGAEALPALVHAIDGRNKELGRRACEALVKIVPWASDEMVQWLADPIHSATASSQCLRNALATAGTAVLPAIARRVGSPGYQQYDAFESVVWRLGDAAVTPLRELARDAEDPVTRSGAAALLGRLAPR